MKEEGKSDGKTFRKVNQDLRGATTGGLPLQNFH